jgi:hypothetical protein
MSDAFLKYIDHPLFSMSYDERVTKGANDCTVRYK